MIASTLHFPSEKNILLLEDNASLVKMHTSEYKIHNRTVYSILNQIWKDTDLCLKQHKSKRDSRGSFYAIHSWWFVPNNVNSTAAEAEAALQISKYGGEKIAWNWEKYVPQHVKNYIILENLKEYRYQDLDPVSTVCHLLNDMRYDKWPQRLPQQEHTQISMRKISTQSLSFSCNILKSNDNTPSVEVVPIAWIRPDKRQKNSPAHGNFIRNLELKKCLRK